MEKIALPRAYTEPYTTPQFLGSAGSSKPIFQRQVLISDVTTFRSCVLGNNLAITRTKKKKKKFHRDTLYAASPQNYRGIPIIHRPWSTKLFQ